MASPIRVLHVVVNMNRGGAETLIMNLYRKMDRKKVQFDFLTCKSGVFDSEITELGGTIHRIPYVSDIGHIDYVKAMDNFFEQHREYKIVHAHMDKMSGLVLRSAKKALIPIRIAHSHSTRSEGNRVAKIYKWFAGTQIEANATHFYACSRSSAEWLFRDRSQQAFILSNGIEIERFQFSKESRIAIRKELNIEEDTFALGHIGRFSHPKNHLFLLELFARVNQRFPNSCLLLVGDGQLKQKIMNEAKQLKINGKVRFLGVREDIHDILQAIDLFVFPSIYEGLPVTLIEAQGAGLHCIVSDTITNEVDMGIGLVKFLPLTDKSYWENEIISMAKKHPPRLVTNDALVKRGYDIRETAQLTQSAYLALGGKVI